MSVIIKLDLPLERRLKQLASTPNDQFPDRTASYWDRYCTIKQWIADEYYQSAGAGLALQGERFTRHDIGHVDDVIQLAGNLLGLGIANSAVEDLHPYELYALLFAILLHDAGNARGRPEHEKMPRAIIARMGPVVSIQPLERRLISQIAEAHGGRTQSGDKDTIAPLQTKTFLGNLQIRPRLLAATLRLADELAENPTRADPQALIKPYDPPESAIHNLYCRTIWVRTDYLANTIFLNYGVTRAQLDEEFVLRPGEPILLVDYIRMRIEKCELERRYCTRFLYPALYDRLSVKLEIYDEDDNLLNSIPLELADDGFPKLPTSITSHQPLLDGEVLRDKYHPKREETCA